MKKLASSVSPFLVLILPILIFVGVSFVIQEEISKPTSNSTSYDIHYKSEDLQNGFSKSFIKLLLKTNTK